jgi:hypothetical protein
MRWTEEEIEKCKTLFKNGENVKNIAVVLNRSEKSIKDKMFKMSFSIKECYTLNSLIEKECEECSDKFISYKKENRKYCSSSCSSKNRNRSVKVDYTRTKKSNCIECSKKIEIKKNASSKVCKCEDCKNKSYKEKKEKTIRKCRKCEIKIEGSSKNIICDKCKIYYYEYYRPSCKFNFNLDDYKDEFDFTLIEKYGWYKPTNRGNNLGGVSRDHMYSVGEGFKNKIDPKIISHPANCRLMKHNENNSKNNICSITLDELLERIKLFENKYKI